MRHFIFSFLITFTTTILFAQDIKWRMHYDTGGAANIVLDEAGFAYVTGSTDNSIKLLTMKIDASGNPVWSNSLSLAVNTIGYDIALDAIGNVYVIGQINKGAGDRDFLLVKYNQSGDTVWTRTFNYGGASSSDIGFRVSVDANNDIYVSGNSWGGLATRMDIHTIKYDSDGNVLWTHRYNGPANNNDYIRNMKLDKEGNLYIIGETPSPSFVNDVLIIKYNSATGLPRWVVNDDGQDSLDKKGYNMVIDDTGNIYVAGESSGYTVGNDYRALIAKYDSAGNRIWEFYHTSGNAFGQSHAYDIALDNNGSVYAALDSDTGGVVKAYIGTLKINAASGNLIWKRYYAEAGPAGAMNDGKRIFLDVCGNPTVYGFTTFTSHMIKYDAAGTVISCWPIRIDSIDMNTSLLPAMVKDREGCFWLAGRGRSPGVFDYAVAKICPYVAGSDFNYVLGSCGDSVSFTSTANACSGPPNYLWNFGDTASGAVNVSSLADPKHKFSSSGTYTVMLIVEENCEIDTVIKTVQYISAQSSSLPDVFICKGDTSTLTIDTSGLSGASYIWQPNYNISDTSNPLPEVYPDSTTTYQLLINLSGCIDTVNIKVEVLDSISAMADSLLELCFGQGDTLHASGGSNYMWYPSSGLSQDNIASPYASPDTTTDYTIIVSLGTCSDTAYSKVIVHEVLDVAVFANPDTIFEGQSAQLYAEIISGMQYQWQPATYLDCDTCPEPLASPDTTITYVLTSTDENGCISMDTITINVKRRTGWFIPNVFSPDNDGKNDLLIFQLENAELKVFKIYDRWGTEVYTSNNNTVNWDGRYNGKELDGNVVVYYAEIKNLNTLISEIIRGSITLIK